MSANICAGHLEKTMAYRSRFTTPPPSGGSVPSLTLWACAAALSVLTGAGCDGNVPQTQQDDLVIPDVTVSRNASEVSRPLENGETESIASTTEVESVTECGEFIPVIEEYDEVTGDFRYEYECADDGGDIARIITEGNDDGLGNGSYTTTYLLRNGGEVVWTVEYTVLADGRTRLTTGTSNEGESYESKQTFLDDGTIIAEETYFYLEGTYIVDGVYEDDGRFNGEYIYDSNETPDVNPDYTIVQTENADGSIEQIYEGIEDGWSNSYVYTVNALGETDYVFTGDDPVTSVSPDYSGAYHYAADGSGEGGYERTYEDGSVLSVEDVIFADQSLNQSWIFNDAATLQDIDQTGEMSYAADGSGSGTVTTFVEGGESQTCTLDIDVDGTTTTVCQ